MSREDVDAVLAAVVDDSWDDGGGLRGVLRQVEISVSGGLLVRDTTTGVVIEPGCGVGLEDWREWQALLDGGTPWLGHSPDPKFEHGDGIARIWPDIDRPGGPACEILLAELPRHLAVVRQDLLGFLGLVREWAPDGLGERLAVAFDLHFHVSVPL